MATALYQLATVQIEQVKAVELLSHRPATERRALRPPDNKTIFLRLAHEHGCLTPVNTVATLAKVGGPRQRQRSKGPEG
jgi:hypothetical protein